MRISVQAVKREHFPGHWTPHRMWPSGEARVVDVVDDPEDPQIEVDVIENGHVVPGKKRLAPDPYKIGQRTFQQLKDEREKFILHEVEDDSPLGDTVTPTLTPDDVRQLLARMTKLEEDRRADKERIATLERRLERAGDDRRGRNAPKPAASDAPPIVADAPRE